MRSQLNVRLIFWDTVRKFFLRQRLTICWVALVVRLYLYKNPIFTCTRLRQIARLCRVNFTHNIIVQNFSIFCFKRSIEANVDTVNIYKNKNHEARGKIFIVEHSLAKVFSPPLPMNVQTFFQLKIFSNWKYFACRV